MNAQQLTASEETHGECNKGKVKPEDINNLTNQKVEQSSR